MLRPLLLARRCASLALVTALLSACGAAAPKSAGPGPIPVGSTGSHGKEVPHEPPLDEAASFMRVGAVTAAPATEPSVPAASAAPDSGPPPPPRLPVTKDKTATATASADELRAELERKKAEEARAETERRGTEERAHDRKGSVEGAVVDSQGGGLSEADVRAAIAGKQASFRRCYDLGVSSAPDFSGSVTLRVAVSPSGNVASAEVLSSSTKVPAVDTCVRDEVRLLMFKATGVGAVVAFPIEFGR